MTTQIMDIGTTAEASVGEAALTMAVGITVQRISSLPRADRKELLKLVKELDRTDDAEDVAAIRTAMREILDQAPAGVRVMDQPGGRRPEELETWVQGVAKRIGQMRRAAGMTQAELSGQSGLPQSHISRIEAGKLSPSYATLAKIAKALQQPLNSIAPVPLSGVRDRQPAGEGLPHQRRLQEPALHPQGGRRPIAGDQPADGPGDRRLPRRRRAWR